MSFLIICFIVIYFFKEVPLGLMAAFYVFNMKYPKEIPEALMALESILLDIVPAKGRPKGCITFVSTDKD